MSPEVIAAIGVSVAAIVTALGRAWWGQRWRPQGPAPNGEPWPKGFAAVVERMAREVTTVHKRLDACEEREKERLRRENVRDE